MKYVRLCTVNDSYEANFIKEDLAEEGIPCMITHETITQLLPNMSAIPSWGIQIMVASEDLPRAEEILGRRDQYAATCTNCGSTNIKIIGSGRSGLMAILGALFVGSIGNVRPLYRCGNCRTEFRR